MFYAVEYVHDFKDVCNDDGTRDVYLYMFNSLKYRDFFVNEFPNIRDAISNSRARSVIALFLSKRSHGESYEDLLNVPHAELVRRFLCVTGNQPCVVQM